MRSHLDQIKINYQDIDFIVSLMLCVTRGRLCNTSIML
jgi:hypothetical protein